MAALEKFEAQPVRAMEEVVVGERRAAGELISREVTRRRAVERRSHGRHRIPGLEAILQKLICFVVEAWGEEHEAPGEPRGELPRKGFGRVFARVFLQRRQIRAWAAAVGRIDNAPYHDDNSCFVGVLDHGIQLPPVDRVQIATLVGDHFVVGRNAAGKEAREAGRRRRRLRGRRVDVLGRRRHEDHGESFARTIGDVIFP